MHEPTSWLCQVVPAYCSPVRDGKHFAGDRIPSHLSEAHLGEDTEEGDVCDGGLGHAAGQEIGAQHNAIREGHMVEHHQGPYLLRLPEVFVPCTRASAVARQCLRGFWDRPAPGAPNSLTKGNLQDG